MRTRFNLLPKKSWQNKLVFQHAYLWRKQTLCPKFDQLNDLRAKCWHFGRRKKPKCQKRVINCKNVMAKDKNLVENNNVVINAHYHTESFQYQINPRLLSETPNTKRGFICKWRVAGRRNLTRNSRRLASGSFER